MRRVVLTTLFVLVALLVVAIEAGDPLFIQVRDSELRATPGFLSPIVAQLEFGDALSYASDRAGWYQVTILDSGDMAQATKSFLRRLNEVTLKATL